MIRLKDCILLLSLFVSVACTCVSCGDDLPAERSDEEVVGIWSDGDGHFLEFADPDHCYDYSYLKTSSVEYWVKRAEVYFYEPYSSLIAKEDTDGVMHIYKVVSVDASSMVLCWVATPDISDIEGEGKYEFLRIFLKNEYTEDPANNITYRRVSQADLEKALGDIEVIEP